MKNVKLSFKKRKYLMGLVHLLAHPVDVLINKIDVIEGFGKHHFKLVLSFIILIFGAYLSHLKQSYVPVYVWDAFSYGIHGIGLAPIAKVLFDIFGIEV